MIAILWFVLLGSLALAYGIRKALEAMPADSVGYRPKDGGRFVGGSNKVGVN